MHTRELLTITAALALLVAPLAVAQTNQTDAVEQPAEWSFDPAAEGEVDWRGTITTWATYAGGAILGWFAVDQLDVSEKDRQDKVTKEAANQAAAQAAKYAEERTLISGPSTPFRYAISGTFAGSSQAALNGATWQPSITFGNQSSTKGGSIAAYALPPSGIGSVSQIVTGLGAWSVVGENEILIEGTGLYDGRARLANVPPPGSLGGGQGMTTNGGLYLSGGSVTAFEVSQ
jgi:hypothetical protein